MSLRDSALWRFLTFQSAPAKTIIEYRDALGVRPIPSHLNQPIWPKRSPNLYLEDAYAKLAIVFRCIGILAQAVASAPLRVYQEAPDGDTELENHAIRQLLMRPNRDSNEARFIGHIAMTISVAGFCVVEKERSTGGRVIGLWPLNPSYCRPIQRLDAAPDWEIRVPGYEPVTLKSEDVIVFTYADRPDNQPTGIGPIEVILREVSLLNIQTDFLKSFFDAGAMPVYGLVLHPDIGIDIEQAQADAIREGWRQRYGGMKGAVDPAILAGVQDIKRLSFDFDELAWNDLRDLSDIAICQAFGIPPILVGAHYGLQQATYSNYREARTSFYEDTVSPMWNRFEDVFSRSLMPDFGGRPNQFLAFDASNVPALREDVMPRRTWAVSALQAGGISTHQFARECGLDPVGADVFLRSIATVEVPAVAPRNTRAIPAVTEDRAFTAFERRRTAAQAGKTAYLKLATKYEPAVQGFLNGQQGRIVAEVTSSFGALGSLPGIETRDVADIDWAEEDRLLAEVLQRLQMAAGDVAFQLAAQETSVSSVVWTLTNPNIRRLMDQLGTRITAINETTRLDVSRVVTESLTEGVSMDELANRLTGLYEETYNGRSMTIARTESQVAYNQAATLGYSESGVVDRIQLFDNPAHDEDYGASDGLSCAQRNGLIVPLAEAGVHINAEHPNGTLAIGAYIEV